MTDERKNNGLTEVLYEDDAYIQNWEATVLDIKTIDGKSAAILDKSAFFPEGGGQGADVGYIGSAKVVDVQRIEGEVLHFYKGELSKGQSYECSLDFDIRYDRMQNHTGEHIICGLINKHYGFDNVGFHLGDDVVTVDLNGFLSLEQLIEIEKEANAFISKGAPVRVLYPTDEEIESIEYRSKIEDLSNVRLVEIEGIDMCACCAPHLKDISYVQCIKILSAMAHRGGVRFTLIAGKRATDDYDMLQEKAAEIVKLTSLPREKMDQGVSKFKSDIEDLRNTINILKDTITKVHMENLKAEIYKGPERAVIIYKAENLDEIQKRTLINEGVTLYKGVLMVMDDNKGGNCSFIAGKSPDGPGLSLKEFREILVKEFGAKGGGSDIMIQGRIVDSEGMAQSIVERCNSLTV